MRPSLFRSPLPRGADKNVRWARQTLVCEIELRGWTADSLIRQGSFKGLREDKPAREVVRETSNPPSRPRRGDAKRGSCGHLAGNQRFQ